MDSNQVAIVVFPVLPCHAGLTFVDARLKEQSKNQPKPNEVLCQKNKGEVCSKSNSTG